MFRNEGIRDGVRSDRYSSVGRRSIVFLAPGHPSGRSRGHRAPQRQTRPVRRAHGKRLSSATVNLYALVPDVRARLCSCATRARDLTRSALRGPGRRSRPFPTTFNWPTVNDEPKNNKKIKNPSVKGSRTRLAAISRAAGGLGSDRRAYGLVIPLGPFRPTDSSLSEGPRRNFYCDYRRAKLNAENFLMNYAKTTRPGVRPVFNTRFCRIAATTPGTRFRLCPLNRMNVS